MYKIELIKSSEIEQIIPFLQILDPNLKESDLKIRLAKMISNNYACIGI
jgi:2-keto-4-pentenoate hydratase